MSHIYAKQSEDGYYDCTAYIGPLESNAPWAMYSYDRPGNILWNAIAGKLYERGWSDEEIKAWLQSKEPRWSLDGELGEAIATLGKMYASQVTK